MAFFLQLVSYWLILWAVSKFKFAQELRDHSLKGIISFSISFIVIGIIHILYPDSLSYMVEGFLPYPRYWIILTGLLEILLAVSLLFRTWRKLIGWAVIVYLVLVFPANINVAINDLNAPGGLPSTPFYIWSRLFFQPIYMVWVYFSAIKSKIIDKT